MKRKPLLIFGFSGFSREVGDIALDQDFSPVYILKDKDYHAKVLPQNYSIICEADICEHYDLPCVIGIGDNSIRQKLFLKYKNRFEFINLIHSSATFGYKQRDQIESSKGTIICAGVRMTNGIQIGDFCIFNLNSTLGHDCVLKDYVNLAPSSSVSGNVRIGSNSWIGTGSVINQGSDEKKLNIGYNTTIGSGSMVRKDCEKNSVYFGTPAKKIKSKGNY